MVPPVSALISTVSGTTHTSQAIVDGNLTVSGIATISHLGVTGDSNANNITASAWVNTTTYKIQGVDFAWRDLGLGVTTIADTSGYPAIDLYGAGGSYYRCDNAHYFTNRAATSNTAVFESNGAIKTYNASGAWALFSDAALKTEIEPYSAGLAEVQKLAPCFFRYTDAAPIGAGTRRIGLVAQEVAPVLPEIVGESTIGERTYATMEPGLLVFVLVNSVKELAAKNAALEARLIQLEAGG